MRTVHDLETAFAELADTAPGADTLTIPTAPARRSRRRVLTPAIAALATAAVIGSVFVVTRPDDRDAAPPTTAAMQALRPPPSEGPADTTIRFTADNPTGTTTVRRYSVDRGAQQLELLIPPGGPRCVTSGATDAVDPNCRRLASVTLMYAGRPTSSDGRAFDRNEIRDRVPQDVNGAEGFFGKPGGNGPVLPDLAGRTQAVYLYWQYAPGAWGEALAGTRAQALALAESVRPAERDLTVPVRLTPTAHQYLNYIHTEPTPVGGGYEISSEDAKYGTAYVTWGEGDSDYDIDVTDTQLQTVNGLRWQFGVGDDGSARAVLQDTSVPVTVSGDIGTSRAAMKAIVERIRLAPDLSDRNTWFPASDLR